MKGFLNSKLTLLILLATPFLIALIGLLSFFNFYSDQSLGIGFYYPRFWTVSQPVVLSTRSEMKVGPVWLSVGFWYDQEKQKELNTLELLFSFLPDWSKIKKLKISNFNQGQLNGVKVNLKTKEGKEKFIILPHPKDERKLIVISLESGSFWDFFLFEIFIFSLRSL
jgi:hypothetical protein